MELKAVIRLKDEFTAKLKKVTSSAEKFSKTTNQLKENQEKLTKATDKNTGAVKKNTNGLNEHSRAASKTNTQLSKQRQAFQGVQSASSSALGTVLRLAAAYVTLQGAMKGVNATIGGAAKMEMTRISMGAMFGNEQDAERMFNFMNKRAEESIFKREDFFTAGQVLTPQFKNDIKNMEYAMDLTERLGASNSEQGMNGGAYALAELRSGDIQSIVERFRFSRTEANFIKAAKDNNDEFLKRLDEVLTSRGFGDEYIGKVAETGLAKWWKLQDQIEIGLSEAGVKGLEKAKPQLDRMSAWLEGEEGQKMFDAVSDGVTKMVTNLTKVGDWIVEHRKEIGEFFSSLSVAATHFWKAVSPLLLMIVEFITKHPKAFANILVGIVASMMLFKGVGWVIGIISAVSGALNFLGVDGKKATKGLKMLAGPLKHLIGILRGVALAFLTLGRAVLMNPIVLAITAVIAVVYLLWKHWDKITSWMKKAWDGFTDWIMDTRFGKWLKEEWAKFEDFIADPIGYAKDRVKESVDKMKGWFAGLTEKAKTLLEKIGLIDSTKGKLDKATEKTSEKTKKSERPKASHRFGSAFIGSDGIYNLHKGERVLTKKENKEYTVGRTKTGGTVTVNFGDVHISGNGDPEQLADKFLKIVTKKLREAGDLAG
ncbi:MAG: hypothetical protein ACQEUT_18170 [Bacillota bacterium]